MNSIGIIFGFCLKVLSERLEIIFVCCKVFIKLILIQFYNIFNKYQFNTLFLLNLRTMFKSKKFILFNDSASSIKN